MKLVKDGDIFISNDEDFIEAYKQNGYVEVEEVKAPPKPRKTSK